MRTGLRAIVVLRGDRFRDADGAAILGLMCAGACAAVLAGWPRTEALRAISDLSGPLVREVSQQALDRFHDPLGETPEPTRAEIEQAFLEAFTAASSDDAKQITHEAAGILLKLDGLRVAMHAAVSRRGDSALARSIVDELVIAGARFAGARRLVGHTLLGEALGFDTSGKPDADEETDDAVEEPEGDEQPEASEPAADETATVSPPLEGVKGFKRWFRSRRVQTGMLIALATGLIAASTLAAAAHLRWEGYRNEVVTERLIEASTEAVETDGALAQLLAAAAWRLDPTDEARAAMTRAAYTPAAGRFTSSRDLEFGSIDFNPDGTSFATLGGDGSVELWDAETMEPEMLDEGAGYVHNGVLDFSPDGLTLLVGTEGPVRLWDLRTREFTELETEHAVDMLRFDWSGTRLATIAGVSSDPLDFEAEWETVAAVWDLETREPITSFTVPGAPTGASFDLDGEELLIATDADAVVRGYDTATGEPTATELDFSDDSGAGIAGFAVSPRSPNDYLVCVSGCLIWRQFDEEGLRPIAAIGQVDDQAGFTPKGDRVLSTVFEEGIAVWDAATGAKVGMLPAKGAIDDGAVSPDGRTVLALSDGEVQRWDLDRLARLRQIQPSLSPPNMSMSTDWSLAVNTTPEGSELWERHGLLPFEKYPERIGLGTALSPDGSVAATVLDGERAVVELWDPESGEVTGTIDDDSDQVLYFDFSDDGSMLYAATGVLDDTGDTAYAEENDVVVWDLDTGDELARVTVDGEWPAESVEVSPDGSTLLTVSGEGATRLWDIDDGSLIGELEGVDSQPYEARFGPDGDLVAAATSDGFALWDIADLAAPQVFDTGFVSSAVEFSPDGAFLAVDESYTVDYDDERPPRVTILDIGSGEVLAALPMTTSYSFYSHISISPDSERLALLVQDGIAIADISYLRGDVYKLACEQAGRDLTRDEWGQYLPEFDYGSLDVCGASE
jgi:WD40 repeat protein